MAIEFPFDTNKLFGKYVKNKTLPKNDFEKQAILLHLLPDFEDDMRYSEEEVNLKIKKYFEDVALLRRELVNFGYMHKDSVKGEYWVAKRELTEQDIYSNTLLMRHARAYGVID